MLSQSQAAKEKVNTFVSFANSQSESLESSAGFETVHRLAKEVERVGSSVEKNTHQN